MSSNFDFLQVCCPVLYRLGNISESYLYTDPNSCMIKLGMFGETVVNFIFKLDNIPSLEYDNTHANRIKHLKRKSLLPSEIDDILYTLRITRNNAIHQNYEDAEKCKVLLENAYTLGVWFLQTYSKEEVVPNAFVLPAKETVNYKKIQLEPTDFEQILSLELEKTQPDNVSHEERGRRSQKALSNIQLSEDQTRLIIDEQLRQVGWEVDTVNLRYSKGTRPTKGRNLAIAEWPTDSNVGDRGRVDYALFVGLKLVALVEAKSFSKDVSSVIDMQCRDYASNIKKEHTEYVINNWREFQVPFIFASNGRKYLEQFKEKSGIWFRDLRSEYNIAKAHRGWVSPSGMLEWLEKDIDTSNKNLQASSYDFLTDKEGLNLRYYQVEAITAAEESIINGSQSLLLAMATGTGKTRTVLGMMYRFLQSNRFRRILFLVDRTALGDQAEGVFADVQIEDLMTLDEMYTIKKLEDKKIDSETRIHVATVQSLIKRIFDNEEEMPAISDYDLIIIDEAHRGYVLDKEMSEEEYVYRNEDDYVSKYRAVIEYFSAVKIALTATPALHTTEIFGAPIYDYSYRQAVIDGYLVDHDAPHILTTKLSEGGINFAIGEVVPIYDPVTGEITNSAELKDELSFDVEQFNRKVITEEFNRTVLTEISNNINPCGEEKTLIYAVDDQHADMIVNLLREIYEPFGIDPNTIMKITSKTGDRKHVLQTIRRYKNEQSPSIAVTVDLLTTGIDIPEITTLVFMRRVKSRILFEQMLGRATRLCPKINKTHFEIYDPVGVYSTLQAVSKMKPVVSNVKTSFADILDGLEAVSNDGSLASDSQIQYQIDMLVAKLQRKQRTLPEALKQHFGDLADNKTPTEFIGDLKKQSPAQAKKFLLSKRSLFSMLDGYKVDARNAVVISHKPDELISHTRGYGRGQRPEDYLQEFKSFITENADKMDALKLICTRPASLTRKALLSLKLELDRLGFTEMQLNSAWKETTNEDVTADIISFIRAQALGSPLISSQDKIHNALTRLKKAHTFTKIQLDWLDRIEKFLMTETVLSEETFNLGAFKHAGGFARIDKMFQNKLQEYITEINSYLYDDGNKAA